MFFKIEMLPRNLGVAKMVLKSFLFLNSKNFMRKFPGSAYTDGFFFHHSLHPYLGNSGFGHIYRKNQ